MGGKTIENELYQQIKGKMKYLRKKNRLTQLDIAKQLHVTVQHYQQIESGTTPPNLKIISKLCEVYDVHPSYFFGISDITIISKDGSVIANKLHLEDLIVLKSTINLSPEAKKSIIDFIKFKQYQAQMEDQNNPDLQ